jgi:hypothetical protein
VSNAHTTYVSFRNANSLLFALGTVTMDQCAHTVITDYTICGLISVITLKHNR